MSYHEHDDRNHGVNLVGILVIVLVLFWCVSNCTGPTPQPVPVTSTQDEGK